MSQWTTSTPGSGPTSPDHEGSGNEMTRMQGTLPTLLLRPELLQLAPRGALGQREADPRLTREAVRAGAEGSLARLRSDRIDLFYIHHDDPETPLEETLGAFSELVQEGRVGHVGLSNFEEDRLREALDVVEREGLAPIVALQNEYNLVARDYERGPRDLVASAGIAMVPYYALASGFLSGKYRPGGSVERFCLSW